MALTAPLPARLARTRPAAFSDGLLAGTRIAVIEPGYATKRFLYERARSSGVELVFVGDCGGWAHSLQEDGVAARLLDADTSGDPDQAAGRILAALGDEARRLDGVVTLWEDAVPATARVARALGLPGTDPATTDRARNKLRTLEASRAAGLPTPRFMHLRGRGSLAAAAEHVGFPAVIKPVFGSGALGCLRVDDLAALEDAYALDSALITPELNVIFRQGTDLMLEEYLDGTEFDVDMVLSGGECVFSAVSENWPTTEPYFVETGMHTPSSHPPERLRALTDLAVSTVLALGFEHGVLHVEVKDTSRGARLLEINARLAGGVITDMHRFVTGVDLLEQQLLIAIGLPATPTPYPQPAGGACGVFLNTSRSGNLTNALFLDHLHDDPSVIQHDVLVEPGEPLTAAPDGFPTVIAEITVTGADSTEAIAKALAIVDELGLEDMFGSSSSSRSARAEVRTSTSDSKETGA